MNSKLYGVSFTFHEQDDSIIEQLNKLNETKKVMINGFKALSGKA